MKYSPNGPPHYSKWQVRIFLILLTLFSATGMYDCILLFVWLPTLEMLFGTHLV